MIFDDEARPMPFGKHRGLAISWVFQNDPSYLYWAHNNTDNFRLSDRLLVELCTKLRRPIPPPRPIVDPLKIEAATPTPEQMTLDIEVARVRDVKSRFAQLDFSAAAIEFSEPSIEIFAMREKRSGDVWFRPWAFGIKRDRQLVIISAPKYETGSAAFEAGRQRVKVMDRGSES